MKKYSKGQPTECEKVAKAFRNKAFATTNKVEELEYNEIADKLEREAKKPNRIKSEHNKAWKPENDRREDHRDNKPQE